MSGLFHYLLAQQSLYDGELREGAPKAVDALSVVEAAVHINKGIGLVWVDLSSNSCGLAWPRDHVFRIMIAFNIFHFA